MNGGPSVDEIMVAINESGYLMEQAVASELERRGLFVRTNVAFENPDEGKSREIDISAMKRVAHDENAKLSAYIELLVECKNSSNPFVFIARPKNVVDRHRSPEEFIFPYRYTMSKPLGDGRELNRDYKAFHYLGFDKVHQAHVNSWKAVQFCRIDRKGSGWHANHGGLYDSMFYPMAKALVARRGEIPKPSRPDDRRYIWLFFPLIVTSGELYLIDSSENEPSPVPVDHVTFERELKSGTLSGAFMVTFVRQEALEAFLQSVVDPLAALSADLIETRQDFLKTTDVPWFE